MAAATPYHDLPGLRGYYLEDSYVRAISLTGYDLSFDLEVVLTSDHPEYAPPKPNEQHCYRRARLSFPHPRRLLFTDVSTVVPTVDADGSIDFGNIDSLYLTASERYVIEGAWGIVEIESDGPLMSVNPE